MPGSVVVHAAVFTAGALLGGGIAAAVAHRNQQQLGRPSPIIEVDTTGKGTLSSTTGALTVASGTLKHGNPGIDPPFASHVQATDTV